MPHSGPSDRELARFFPRIAISLLSGFIVFLVVTGLYVLPVLRQDPPPGAIADWHKEQVMARLEGKVLWFLAGSMISVTLLFTLRPRNRRDTL